MKQAMFIPKQRLLFIGQLAAQSGIPIKTIRYYEALGLLRASGRTKGGFRVFLPEVLNRLAFIQRAKIFGLSLEEIEEMLKIYNQGCCPSGNIKQKLKDTILAIDRKIEELRWLQTELRGLLCPLLS